MLKCLPLLVRICGFNQTNWLDPEWQSTSSPPNGESLPCVFSSATQNSLFIDFSLFYCLTCLLFLRSADCQWGQNRFITSKNDFSGTKIRGNERFNDPWNVKSARLWCDLGRMMNLHKPHFCERAYCWRRFFLKVTVLSHQRLHANFSLFPILMILQISPTVGYPSGSHISILSYLQIHTVTGSSSSSLGLNLGNEGEYSARLPVEAPRESCLSLSLPNNNRLIDSRILSAILITTVEFAIALWLLLWPKPC